MDRDPVRERKKSVCEDYIWTRSDRDVFRDNICYLTFGSSERGFEQLEDMDTSETDWRWFFLADCGSWHMFQVDAGPSCSVTNAQIEQSYNRNQHGAIEFCTAKYNYRLDFSAMQQINMTTGGRRLVRRSFHSVTDFRFICDNLSLPVPSHWEKINTDEPYQLIQLEKDTNEFKQVACLYNSTMHQPIKSIQRIQNLDLWEFFCRKKTQLRKVKRIADIQERMLFHGTGHSNIKAICTHNFDWRLTGSNGERYGKGCYFSKDAKLSSNFCITTVKHNAVMQKHGLAPPIFANEPPYKTMFLARVLVGEYTRGHYGYCRPPSKDTTLTNFYDSCVDDIASPQIYVIFDSNQIYPEYLIEFY